MNVEIFLVILILAYSIILHEVSHGFVAYLNGDRTAKEAGRITLNPLPHIDLLGTILLPALLIFFKAGILFGWAKPVPFDPRNFRNKTLGVFTVGVAGPLTNLLLAVVFGLAFREKGMADPFAKIYLYGTSINIFLALLNLVPIPPLDGSRAVGALLPKTARDLYYSLEPFGFFILIFLLYSGLLQRLIIPVYKSLLGVLTGVAL
ncbi:MAG: site-2 protease family protein [Candidatus Omnitrophota bacterium]